MCADAHHHHQSVSGLIERVCQAYLRSVGSLRCDFGSASNRQTEVSPIVPGTRFIIHTAYHATDRHFFFTRLQGGNIDPTAAPVALPRLYGLESAALRTARPLRQRLHPPTAQVATIQFLLSY
jgi:hypothetical protein